MDMFLNMLVLLSGTMGGLVLLRFLIGFTPGGRIAAVAMLLGGVAIGKAAEEGFKDAKYRFIKMKVKGLLDEGVSPEEIIQKTELHKLISKEWKEMVRRAVRELTDT